MGINHCVPASKICFVSKQVGPKTSHNVTQCFSTHLTTFASSHFVLPISNNQGEFIYQTKTDVEERNNFTQYWLFQRSRQQNIYTDARHVDPQIKEVRVKFFFLKYRRLFI